MTAEAVAPAESNPDVEAIRRNRDAILGEKKSLKTELEAVKAQLAEAEANQSELKIRLDQANNRIADFELNYPVEQFLERVAIDVPTFKHVFGERYKFTLVDGKPCLTDLESKPLEVPDPRSSKGKTLGLDDAQAFRDFLAPAGSQDPYQGRLARLLVGSRATGSGASAAGKGSGTVPSMPPAPEAPKPVYGLR